MNKVSTINAKNRLSKLIAAAVESEPQIITENGVEVAVLISYNEYRKLIARKGSLIDFLLESPLSDSNLDLARSKTSSGRVTLDL